MKIETKKNIYRNISRWINIALIFSLVFVVFGCKAEMQVEDQEVIENKISWSYAESVLNDVSFQDNSKLYEDMDFSINYLYITTFDTKNEDGITYTLSDFDKHEARKKDYNPELEILIQQGDDINTSIEGELGYEKTKPNASFRVRGNSSRGADLKSFKVRLYDEQWYGESTLIINKHFNDDAKITNRFSMDLISELPNIASFRSHFIQLYVKDASLGEYAEFVDYGLYVSIEQPNKTYLETHDLDKNGAIYKANQFEFRLYEELKNVDDPLYDEAEFERILAIREGDDHSKIIDMLENVNNMNIPFDEVFEQYFDRENYITWLAVNILLGNEDTIAHNFLLYSPNNSNKWMLLPWDYDGAFRFDEQASRYNVTDSLYGVPRFWPILLHRRFFSDPQNVEDLTAKINDIADNYFTQERVDYLIGSYWESINFSLTKQPDASIGDISYNEMLNYYNRFYKYLQDNRVRYLNSLQYPMPVYVADPQIEPNGQIRLAWSSSYDFQRDTLIYELKIANNPFMRNPIVTKSNIFQTTCVIDALKPGTYYVTLTTDDGQGHVQISAEFYNDQEASPPIVAHGVRQIIIK